MLAAGMSKRLRPLTDDLPKCLLDIHGKTILDRALENLIACGFSDFVIVTGYKAEMIREHVTVHYENLNVSWFHSDRYFETNNAYSLLLTEEALTGSFLLLDSDVLFSSDMIKRLLSSSSYPCIALDRHPCSDEEIKVVTDKHDHVVDIGKHIDPAHAAGESIGFEIFSGSARKELFAVLKRRIRDEKRENEFYEASFKEMISAGTEFTAIDTSEFPAMEIDSLSDLERAKSLLERADRHHSA